MSWSSPETPGIPHSSDAPPNWAADTDPVSFGAPEPAFSEPSQTQFQREEGMSTAEFGDLNGQAPAPAPATDGLLSPLTVSPAAPVEPLVQPAYETTEAIAPVESVETPAVPVQDMREVPLGTLIFRAGLLTEEQLEEALQDGMRRGKRLGEVLLERGLVSESDLGRMLAGQRGLPFVELDAAAIDPAAVQLLPVEKARLHSMLPIGFQDGLPVVAVADPSNDLVLENVRRALNCEPHLVVAGREALHRQIELAYGGTVQVEAVAAAPQEPVAAPVAPVVAETPVVPASPAPPPLVVQPQAPPGEGVWLGAPPPESQPEPAFQDPQPVVAPEPVQPVVASEPVVQAPVVEQAMVQPVAETPVFEPAVEQSQPEPVSIAYTPVEPVTVTEPVFTPTFTPSLPETPASAAGQPSTDAEPEGEEAWLVVLRLADGEQLEIGTFGTSDEAKDHAQSIVRQISSEFGWPFFEGRFIRPDVIVSVDLLAPEGNRWLGSSARRAWAQPS